MATQNTPVNFSEVLEGQSFKPVTEKGKPAKGSPAYTKMGLSRFPKIINAQYDAQGVALRVWFHDETKVVLV